MFYHKLNSICREQTPRTLLVMIDPKKEFLVRKRRKSGFCITEYNQNWKQPYYYIYNKNAKHSDVDITVTTIKEFVKGALTKKPHIEQLHIFIKSASRESACRSFQLICLLYHLCNDAKWLQKIATLKSICVYYTTPGHADMEHCVFNDTFYSQHLFKRDKIESPRKLSSQYVLSYDKQLAPELPPIIVRVNASLLGNWNKFFYSKYLRKYSETYIVRGESKVVSFEDIMMLQICNLGCGTVAVFHPFDFYSPVYHPVLAGWPIENDWWPC